MAADSQRPEPAPSTADFAALCARARAGDATALGELLEASRGRVHAFVRLRLDGVLRAREEDLDIVQSTFRLAVEGFPQFRGASEAEFLGWLLSVARNKIREKERFWKRQRRDVGRVVRLGSISAQVLHSYAAIAGPSEQVAALELGRRLEAAFDALSPEHREVITMARVLGLPHALVAAQLGRSEVAVRQLLVRALRALADRFGPVTGSEFDLMR